MVGGTTVWIARSLLPTAMFLNSKKNTELTTLVLMIYANKLLLVVVAVIDVIVVVEKSITAMSAM